MFAICRPITRYWMVSRGTAAPSASSADLTTVSAGEPGLRPVAALSSQRNGMLSVHKEFVGCCGKQDTRRDSCKAPSLGAVLPDWPVTGHPWMTCSVQTHLVTTYTRNRASEQVGPTHLWRRRDQSASPATAAADREARPAGKAGRWPLIP